MALHIFLELNVLKWQDSSYNTVSWSLHPETLIQEACGAQPGIYEFIN